MPVCKNDIHRTYRGTELSPLGRGYSAKGDKNGMVRVGKDGEKWVAGNTKWKRFTKRGAHRYQLSEQIAKDIRK